MLPDPDLHSQYWPGSTTTSLVQYWNQYRNGWIRKNDYCVGVRRAEPAQQGGDREEEAEEQAGEQGEGRQATPGGQVRLPSFLEVSTSYPKMNEEECRAVQSHLGT